MICPSCRAEGRKSTVQELGGSTTCLYYAPFYDEDGERHHHDGNIRTMGYRCSNSHRWEEKSVASCWCGWGTPKGDAGPATQAKP